jgi:ankyrin repeat protein
LLIITVWRVLYQTNTEVVRMLFGKNPDLNARDYSGWTSLMWAAWEGHEDTVKVLLNRGVELRMRNNYAETAAIPAEKGNHPETLNY